MQELPAGIKPLSQVDVNGIKIDLVREGNGQPMVVLHDVDGSNGWQPYIEPFAASCDIWIPSHPGFDHSERPEDYTQVEDLVYFYLDFLELFHLSGVTLIGMGLGGWIAAELAIRNTGRLNRLVLVDAVGIRVSDEPDSPDIRDTFPMPWEKKLTYEWHDVKRARQILNHPGEMTEAELEVFLRNQESLFRYTWKPFMHNPKLLQRLYRIQVPTAVIWGESDRVVTVAYGKVYAKAIPNATFDAIPEAGHHPHLEQPERFSQVLQRILSS